MSKINKTTKSALMIVIFSLISKLLGFFRDILIASKFGSGMITDTFFIALSAISIIGGFLINGIGTTFIPVITEIENSEGKKGKIEHTNNLLNVVFLVSVVLVIITILGAPILVKLVAYGFNGRQFDLAVRLTKIGLPILLFSGIMGVLTGYLQSEGKFKATAIMGIPFNGVYILFLFFFSSYFGIEGLMYAGVIATSSQLFIQVLELKSTGLQYRFIFNLKDIYIRKMLSLSLPIMVGVIINDLNAIVDKSLASSLVSGSISALNYASKLNGLILGVFITSITTVIFPLLAHEANNNNIDSVKLTMAHGINLILLITVPATVGLIALSVPIVEIAFQRGKFDAMATIMTSQALIFYSIGLIPSALRLLITRVYYSLQDTKTPMINGAISVALNIILNFILVRFMSHAGLAFATSISITITTTILLYQLKKKIGPLGTKGYIMAFLKIGLASAVMGLIAYIVYNGLYKFLGISKLNNLISLLVAVGLAIIVYAVLCYIFKVEEVKDIIGKIKVRLVK